MEDEIRTDQDHNHATSFPRLLADDATLEDVVKAVNGLALEMQGMRVAIQELGTRIENALLRLERRGGR